jgi:uncharacterized protein
MTEKTEKMLYVGTAGPDDPERATFPFVLAVAALATDMEAVVVLQGAGVNLARKGVPEIVHAPGLPPLASLLADFTELGGKLVVCAPCVNHRQMADYMLDQAEFIAAAGVNDEILTADGVVTY